MTIGARHHSVEKKRTIAEHNAYMRDYMRNRRADRVRVADHSHMVAASSYDVGRHELRDGTGTPMWPERVKGSATPYTDAMRAIEAAAKRRKSSRIAIPTPTAAQPRRRGETKKRKFEWVDAD